MRFGVAKECITPPFPMKLACTGSEDDLFEAIHDDIYVRCLFLGDGALLISYDLLFHDRSLNDALADYAEQTYGISKSAVCVSYTHAHTAPAVKGYNPMHQDDRYEALLVEKGKRCIDEAMASLFEGYAEYASTEVDLNLSRRGYVNGRYINAPNFHYDHDRELFVLCVRDAGHKVRSVMVNYACHPVFYPAMRTLSGEFPARTCQLLDEKYPDAVALFFQSAGGDVRPAATVTTRTDGSYKWGRTNFAAIDRFSAMLADHVGNLLSADMKKVSLPMAAAAFSVELPIDGVPLRVFEEERERYQEDRWHANKTNAEWIVNGGYESLPDSLILHCQLLRFGNLYMAAMGGEPCYGIKKAVAEVLAGADLCFIGYTDACAYIVDDKVLAEGGYEAECHLEYGLKGPFRPGITQRITEGFEKASQALQEEDI